MKALLLAVTGLLPADFPLQTGVKGSAPDLLYCWQVGSCRGGWGGSLSEGWDD